MDLIHGIVPVGAGAAPGALVSAGVGEAAGASVGAAVGIIPITEATGVGDLPTMAVAIGVLTHTTVGVGAEDGVATIQAPLS